MIDHFVAEQTDAGLDFDIMLAQDKKVYCFIGDNAVGKTNLLENMASTLVYCHSMFEESGNGKYSGIYMHKPILDEIEKFSFKLALNIILNEKNVKNKENDKWMFAAFDTMQTNRSAMNLPFTIDKPIVFIGAKNRGYTKNRRLDANVFTTWRNYYHCFMVCCYCNYYNCCFSQ
jgi:AAA15 family ATPase/GTPase